MVLEEVIALREQGATQKQLSEMFGVSTATINNWLSGKNKPRNSTKRSLEPKPINCVVAHCPECRTEKIPASVFCHICGYQYKSDADVLVGELSRVATTCSRFLPSENRDWFIATINEAKDYVAETAKG